MQASTRTAWDTAAASFTVPNRLGEHVHLSGFQLFMKYKTRSIVPPLGGEFLPPILATQPSVLFTTAEVFDGGPFNVQVTPIAPTEYNRIDVWGSRPFTSRPRKFLRYRDMRFSYGPITTPKDIWANFVTTFGAPALGETVGVRLTAARQGFIDPPPITAILTVQP